jgi:quinol monooxygenase YgiN
MSEEIYWLVTCVVKPGKFEDFKKTVKPLVAATKAEEGSQAYDYSVNDDETLVLIYESYRDSAAIVSHVTTVFAPFADAFFESVDITKLVVFGDPSPEAREILAGLGAEYMTPFEGFTHK